MRFFCRQIGKKCVTHAQKKCRILHKFWLTGASAPHHSPVPDILSPPLPCSGYTLPNTPLSMTYSPHHSPVSDLLSPPLPCPWPTLPTTPLSLAYSPHHSPYYDTNNIDMSPHPASNTNPSPAPWPQSHHYILRTSTIWAVLLFFFPCQTLIFFYCLLV